MYISTYCKITRPKPYNIYEQNLILTNLFSGIVFEMCVSCFLSDITEPYLHKCQQTSVLLFQEYLLHYTPQIFNDVSYYGL